MKIAVMATGSDSTSYVAETFAEAQWLLIADMDDMRICEAAERRDHDPENVELAKLIVARDCESVICGEIAQAPFEVLADHGVTRSLGRGLTVVDALNRESLLDLITDYIGGTGCHPSNTCHGCDHDA